MDWFHRVAAVGNNPPVIGEWRLSMSTSGDLRLAIDIGAALAGFRLPGSRRGHDGEIHIVQGAGCWSAGVAQVADTYNMRLAETAPSTA